jgi:hypothetical protein
MTPHHKPKNITLTRIARLSKGNTRDFRFVADTDADRALSGQHQGFEVSQAALERIRAGLI